MSVYFAMIGEGGPIKVGHSVDVPARMQQLEAYYGRPMVLLHTEPGGRPEETTWHDRLAGWRLGRTEQFKPSPEVLGAIGKPVLVDIDPDVVEVVRPVANLRPVRLDLPPDVHRLLRLIAADEETSMAAYARDVLERFLKEEAKRRGIKA